MTTILLDPTTGSDANDGITSAVRTSARAIWQATSGDVISVTGTTIANPLRGQITLPAGVMIKSGDSGKQWFSSNADVSEGAVYEKSTHNGVFTADYTTWGSGGTGGTPAIGATQQLFGAGCLELNAGDYIRRTAYTTTGDTVAKQRKFRYRIGYKMSVGTENLVMRIDTTTDANDAATRFAFKMETQEWIETNTFNDGDVYDAEGNLANATDWTELVTPWMGSANTFTGTNVSTGQFHYLKASGGTAYIQYIIMEEMAEWTLTGTADVYQMPLKNIVSATVNVASRVSEYHGGSAISGLMYATDSSDYETYRISEGDGTTTPPTANLASYHNDTAGIAQIKIPSGESISDYSLYFTMATVAIDLDGAVGGGQLLDISMIGCQLSAQSVSSATWELENFSEYVSLASGVWASGTSTINWKGGGSYQPVVSPSAKYYGGGIVAGQDASANIATVNCYGVHVQNAGDDAYQPIGASIVNMYGCTEDGAAGNAIELNCSNSGSMIINGFTTTGVIRDQSTSATTVTMSGVVCASIEMDQNQTRTYTVGTDCFCEAGVISYTGGALAVANLDNNVNFDYTVDYNVITFEPNSDSVLVGAAPNAPGADSWFIGANGEPFSNVNRDAGGIQSTHSPTHPKNT